MILLHRLHCAQQLGSELFLKQLNGHGDDITVRQAVLLDAIKGNPGGTQTALVEITGIDRSTLADVAKRIMKKGWITRRRTKDDARAYAIKLTDEGKKMLALAAQAARKAEAELIAKMPEVRSLS